MHVGRRLRKLVREDGGHRVRRGEQRGRDLGPIADHHRDRHRLAEGAGQREEGRAEDARACVRQHHLAHRLPAGRAERERSVALRLRDRKEDLASDRDDVWHDHHREQHAGREEPDAVDGSREERDAAEETLDRRPDGAHQRHEHEDAHQPVDDARHCDEQLQEEREPVAQAPRHQLGEADRRAEAERRRDGERDGRRRQRPVDERQRPELREDGVPDAGPEKAPAEGVPGRGRLHEQLDRDRSSDGEHGQREAEGSHPECGIGETPARCPPPGRRPRHDGFAGDGRRLRPRHGRRCGREPRKGDRAPAGVCHRGGGHAAHVAPTLIRSIAWRSSPITASGSGAYCRAGASF